MAYQERLSGLITNANFASTTGWTTSAFTTVGTSYRSSSSAGRGSSSSGSGSAEQTVDISTSTHLAEIDAGTAPCLVAYAQAYSRAGGGATDDPGNRIACTATFLDASNAVLGSVTNSPGTAPANKSLGWEIVELAGAVPAGTRKLKLRFDLVRTNGGITNLFVDDCELWLYEGAPRARAHRPQARVLYTGSLTGAVRVSRAAVEVLRTLAAGNVGGISFTAPIRNLGFEDQQDKLDWVEGSGTLNIVSGATNGVTGPHGGTWYGRVQASTTAARHIHKELDLTAWVTGDQIDNDRVAVELSGWLASSSSLVLAQLELNFWDSQPAITGAIQVGSDHLSPTVNSSGWASRTTGVIDVPAGARWVWIGWGCPISTSTQYACADDLVLSVITDSEPGAGADAGAYRPLLQIAI